MAAVRGRSVRTRNTKGRQNDENVVRLDYRKDPGENLREILVHLIRSDVSKAKKLGYYNAFVRLRYRFGSNLDQHLTKEEILVCLRLGLFHKAKEMRAACLRALRYFCIDWDSVNAVLKLHIDFLIVRSIDICLDNDIERVHAMRLIRKILSISPERFPSSLLNPMISIANDGSKLRDKLVKTCLAIICELALHNARLVARHGGIGAILHNVLDCHQLPRVNESLMATILSLLNHPRTRSLIKPDVDLEKMLAPFTDFDYKYAVDTSDQSGEESEFKYDACKMALATIVKSWSGMIRLCKPEASGLQSLIGMLYLPNMETRKEIMDVMFDIFRLSVPLWTDSFSQALVSIDPSEMNETWKLTEGFVVEEGKSLLLHLARTRPNLVDNHMAIILSAFISAGLFEALTETIATSCQYVSVRATILLGELLHLSTSILPDVTNHYHQCLPSLMERAANFSKTCSLQSQAAMAITCLAHLDAMKRRGPRPRSLYLSHLLECVQQHAPKLSLVFRQQQSLLQHIEKDRDRDFVNQAVRDSQVLYTKDNQSWDLDIVATLLKSPNESMKRLEDQQLQRFIRRLVYLFKPSKKVFSIMELMREDVWRLTVTGLSLIEFLTECDAEEGQKSIRELLADIRDCLAEVVDQRGSRETVFAPSALTQTCSQYYFLFIGKMSSSCKGDALLEQMKLYEVLLSLMCPATHDLYVKLITSCLDYTHSSNCRNVLSKGLTSTSDNARLYITGFMRVLLRTRVPSFCGWGIEALLGRLSDNSTPVAMEALSVLSEACEDPKNLLALIKFPLSIDHLGHKGDLLFARFLSTEEGFQTFSKSTDPSEPSRVAKELDKWRTHYNLKYVHIVEERLTEALTTYEKTYDGSYVRRSHRRVPRKDVLVPVHLYGQLVQHEKGARLLAEEPYIVDIFDTIRFLDLKTESQILKLKAALWAVGHIGRSVWGVALLQQNNIISTIIKLAEDSGVFTIRGTAVYVLGLIASTSKGAEVLHEFGWESVRRARTGVLHMSNVVDDSEDGLLGNSRQLYRPNSLQAESEIQTSDFVRGSPTEAISFFAVDDNHYIGSCSSCPPVLPSLSEQNESLSHSELVCSSSQSRNRPRLPSVSEGKDSDVLSNLEVRGENPIEAKRLSNHDVCYLRSPDAVSDFPVIGKSDSDPPSTCVNHGSHCTNDVPLRSNPDRNLSPRTLLNGPGRSCSDIVETAASSGISSFESGTFMPGIASQTATETVVSSSLDTAKQTFLGAEAVVTSESSESLRQFANLRPIPTSAAQVSRSSRTLPCIRTSNQRPFSVTTRDQYGNRFTASSQDIEGYAALWELKPPRTSNQGSMQMQTPSVSLATPYLSKTRSLDFRPSRPRVSLRRLMPKMSLHGKLISSCAGFRLRTNSLHALEDVPSKAAAKALVAAAEIRSAAPPPAAQTVPDGQSSTSLNSFEVFGRPEYIGICVPVDISMIFQVNEGEDLRSQVTDSDTEVDNIPKSKSRASRVSRHNSLPPDDLFLNLEHHNRGSCLGCYRICSKAGGNDDQGESSDVFCAGSLSSAEVLTVRGPSLKRDSSSRKCSFSGDFPAGSITSQTSAESVPIDKELLAENSSVGKAMIRKEVLRLVINLGSSVGVKGTEQALLIMKQKFPTAFQDLCLYSEVCLLLNNYSFRLVSRRFVQELFQDLNFDECVEDPQNILRIPEDSIIKFSEQFETDHHLHQVLEY